MTLPRFSQDPTEPAFVQDPYPTYDRMRTLGPFFLWEEYGFPMAAGFEAASAILKDRRFGREQATPDHPPYLAPFYHIEAHSMLEADPPRHTRLRGAVLREFTGGRIAKLEPEIASLCHRLIDQFPDTPFDLLRAYATHVPVITIARLIGVPETMADQLLAWSNAIVAMYQARRDEALERSAAAASKEFTAYIQDLIADRKHHPTDDLLGDLVGSDLSDDEVTSTGILLLNAGHEATVHTIGNGVKLLLERGLPVAGTETIVEEILRLDPPLHMFSRIAREDVDILGHTFPAGQQVGCLLAAANRDAGKWSAPNQFDPTRKPDTNLAFGAGIHFCVGAPLARLELRIALNLLGARCPHLTLAEPPKYSNLYHFHGLERLMVTCTPAT